MLLVHVFCCKHGCSNSVLRLQMTKQLENEKERLIDKKRNEQEERQRKQLELERILEDNRRLVTVAFYLFFWHSHISHRLLMLLANHQE